MSENADIMRAAAKELLRDARKALEQRDDNESAHAEYDMAMFNFVLAVAPKVAEKLRDMRAKGPGFWYA